VRPVLVAGAAVAAAGLVVGAVLASGAVASAPAPDRSAWCATHAAFVAVVERPGPFATQTTNHLARQLSQQVRSAPDPAVAAAGDGIRRVLSTPAWELPDLVVATRPVALDCGWSWPITTTPPAPLPRPPAG
jgi:hypothetical protein